MKTIVKTALMSAVVIGLSGAAGQALAGSHAKMEKCAGVVKAGQNDCGGKANACAGQAKTDGAADAWVYVPKGTCNKLVNGKVLAK